MPCPHLFIPFGAAVAGPKKQTGDSAGQAEKRRLRRAAVETVGAERAGFLLERPKGASPRAAGCDAGSLKGGVEGDGQVCAHPGAATREVRGAPKTMTAVARKRPTISPAPDRDPQGRDREAGSASLGRDRRSGP